MNIAILGAGRIGAALARSFMVNPANNINLTLIIDTVDCQKIADRILYDSWHGKLAGQWSFEAQSSHLISTEKQPPQTVATRQASAQDCLGLLQEFNIDSVIDCTGRKLEKPAILASLSGRNKRKILLSQPDQNNTDLMHIFGMQHAHASTDQALCEKINQANIISAASCTSIALAPVAQIIDKLYGISFMRSLTLHSAMNDQHILDSSDSLSGSSGVLNLVPTPTKLNLGIEKILPNLKHKVASQAIRVPIVPTCAMDVVFELNQATDSPIQSLDDLQPLFTALQNYGQSFTSTIAGCNPPLINLCDEVLTSMKVLGSTSFCSISTQDIEISNHSLRLLLWFDNEIGFAHHLRLCCELINHAGLECYARP